MCYGGFIAAFCANRAESWCGKNASNFKYFARGIATATDFTNFCKLAQSRHEVPLLGNLHLLVVGVPPFPSHPPSSITPLFLLLVQSVEQKKTFTYAVQRGRNNFTSVWSPKKPLLFEKKVYTFYKNSLISSFLIYFIFLYSLSTPENKASVIYPDFF